MKSTPEKILESYKFIKAQLNAIDKSKYIESQKAHRDLYFDEQGRPSQDFFFWWIEQHAEKFRKAWDTSLCKNCSKVFQCKDCLKEQCSDFDNTKTIPHDIIEMCGHLHPEVKYNINRS